MANSFKFFYNYKSPLARCLLILFERNNVQCEKISVALEKGEHLKKNYGENINRFHKVPCIHDNDGFKLSETIAIYHYLTRKSIIPSSSDSKEVAQIDEFLSWSHNSLLASVGTLFFETWVKPFRNINIIPHGMMVNVKNPHSFVELDQSLSDLENIWLRDSDFVVGDKITFADLLASCVILQLVATNLFIIDEAKYPKVIKWLSSVKDFYNPEFDDVHRSIYQLGKLFSHGPPAYLIFASNFMRKINKMMK